MAGFSRIPVKGKIIYFCVLFTGSLIIGINSPKLAFSPELLFISIAAALTYLVKLPLTYASQDIGGPFLISCLLSDVFTLPELVVIALAQETFCLSAKRPLRWLRYLANCAEGVISLSIAWVVWQIAQTYFWVPPHNTIFLALLSTFAYILSNLTIMNVLIKYFYPRPPVRLVDNYKLMLNLTLSTRSFEYIIGILCAIIYREMGGTVLVEILVLFFVVGFAGNNSAKNLVQKMALNEQLHHRELYLRDLVEVMELGLVATDSNGRIMHFNSAAEKILLVKLSAEQPADKIANLQSYLDIEPNKTIETKINDRIIHVRRTPIHESENRVGGNIFLFEDITEAKIIEDYAMHKDRLTLLGEFSAGVMHEISKPLTMLSLAYEEISSSTSDLPSKYLNILGRSIDDLTDLSQQLLNFSSPHHGRGKNLSNLLEVLTETIEIAGALAKKKQITFLLDQTTDLFVNVNEHELRQVFLSLISNAIDVTPECGTIRFDVGIGAYDKDDNPVWEKDYSQGRVIQGWFAVEDQGTGFTNEAIARLGDSFFTTKDEGHGLGLTIVLHLLKRWGARIRVFHRLTGGSRIVVEL